MFNLFLKSQKFSLFTRNKLRGFTRRLMGHRILLNFFFISRWLGVLSSIFYKASGAVKKNKIKFFFIKYLTVRGGFKRTFRKKIGGLTVNFFKKKINFFKKSFIIASCFFFLKKKRKRRTRKFRLKLRMRYKLGIRPRKNWKVSFKSRLHLKDLSHIGNKETPLGYKTWFFKSSNKGRFFLKRW